MNCSPQILRRLSGHVAQSIYRTRDYTRSNRVSHYIISRRINDNVVIVFVVLVLVPGNGMFSNLYNAGVRGKKYGGKTHVRARKKKKRKLKKKKGHYLPRNRCRRLIPCAPFGVLREKERAYLRSKSIHNENPTAIGDPSIVHRSAHTHVHAPHGTHVHVTLSETQRSFFRFPPS